MYYTDRVAGSLFCKPLYSDSYCVSQKSNGYDYLCLLTHPNGEEMQIFHYLTMRHHHEKVMLRSKQDSGALMLNDNVAGLPDQIHCFEPNCCLKFTQFTLYQPNCNTAKLHVPGLGYVFLLSLAILEMGSTNQSMNVRHVQKFDNFILILIPLKFPPKVRALLFCLDFSLT